MKEGPHRSVPGFVPPKPGSGLEDGSAAFSQGCSLGYPEAPPRALSVLGKQPWKSGMR
jgi:hypothetical protein